jgi:hypothetical protein
MLALCTLLACSTRINVLQPTAGDGGGSADLGSADLGSADLSMTMSGGDAATSCDPNAMDTPSRQTVHFVLHNNTAIDRYVVTSGWYCDPFSISKSAGNLPLNLGFQCLCECPALPSGEATTYHRIATGGSYDLSWDARMLIACSVSHDCGSFTIQEVVGTHQPVGPAFYQVAFGIETALRSSCQPAANPDDYACQPSSTGAPPAGAIPAICPAGEAAATGFTLPAAGDLTVDVSLCRPVGSSCVADGDCCSGTHCAGSGSGSGACLLGP